MRSSESALYFILLCYDIFGYGALNKCFLALLLLLLLLLLRLLLLLLLLLLIATTTTNNLVKRRRSEVVRLHSTSKY